MTAAALDRLLAALVLVMAASGLLTLRAGSPAAGWVFVVHGLLAGATALAVAWKLARSAPRAAAGRRWGRLALGLLVALVAAAALSGGFLWVAGGELATVGGWTLLTVHAWAGLALVPLVVAHLLPRRWRLLAPTAAPRTGARDGRWSRRSLLVGGLFGLAGLGAYAGAEALDRLRGGSRRFTGSRFLASGGIPPPTTFLGEPAPPVDRATWRLSVAGRVAEPRAYDLGELRDLGQEQLVAVLDCTSGWAIETSWRGVPLAAVLAASAPDAGARRVEVRSVTGWATSLSLAEAADCLLATEVAGVPLPPANGAPVRLVVPGRRGLDWVKWAGEVVVT